MPLTGDSFGAAGGAKSGSLQGKEHDGNQGCQLTSFEDNETNNTVDLVENAQVQYSEKYKSSNRKLKVSQN